MAIVRFPLKTDPEGKCTRWKVSIYNRATHRAEWTTVRGKLSDAQAFERQQKSRQASGVYISRRERRSFAQVVEMFLAERRARNRRRGTLASYETALQCHLLEAFGRREVGPGWPAE